LNIKKMLSTDRIIDLEGTTKEEILKEMIEVMSKAPEVTDQQAFLEAILEREKIMSTGIGIGIAVPHVKIPAVTDFVIALGRTPKGVDFDSLDGKPVHLVIMIGASDKQKDQFLRVLAKVSLLFKEESFRKAVLNASGAEEIMELLDE